MTQYSLDDHEKRVLVFPNKNIRLLIPTCSLCFCASSRRPSEIACSIRIFPKRWNCSWFFRCVFEIECFSAFLIIFFKVDIPSKLHSFSPRKNTQIKQKSLLRLSQPLSHVNLLYQLVWNLWVNFPSIYSMAKYGVGFLFFNLHFSS